MDSCDLLCLDLDVAEKLRSSLDVAAIANLAANIKLAADPTRLLVMHALREHELCGCDLAWITGQSEKVVSHHLSRLRAAGLAENRRDGRIVMSSLTAKGQAFMGVLAEVAA